MKIKASIRENIRIQGLRSRDRETILNSKERIGNNKKNEPGIKQGERIKK